MKQPQGKLRFMLAGISLFEAFCMCGTVFGWPALVLILKKEKIFLGSCDFHIPNCKPQDLAFNLIFTISGFSVMALTLPWGFLLDRFGPKLTHFIGTVLFITGCLLLAFASNDFPAFMPGMVCLAAATGGVYLSFFHISNLFVKPGVYMSLLTGSFDSSVLIFWLFDQLNADLHVARKDLFIGLAVLGVLFMLMSLVWPSQSYVPPIAPGDAGPSAVYSSSLRNSTLWRQLMSAEFFSMVIYASVSLTRLNYYFGTAQPQLFHDFGKPEGTILTSAFTIIVPTGVLSSPLVGILQNRFGFVAVLLITVVLGSVWSGIMLIHHTISTYFSFWLFGVYRAFVFSTMANAISSMFGFGTFGRTFGTQNLIAASFSLLQYPIVDAVNRYFDGNYLDVNIIFLFCLASLAVIPLFLWRREKMWARREALDMSAALLDEQDHFPFGRASDPIAFMNNKESGTTGIDGIAMTPSDIDTNTPSRTALVEFD